MVLPLWLVANDPTLISEQFQNTTLKQVFKQLKRKYRLKIAFSDRLVADKTISAKVDELEIGAAFETILKGTGLTYEYIYPNAVIIKKGKPVQASFDLIGEVFDKASGERLPFALVKASDGVGTLSNEDGFFTLKGLNDSSRVVISYLGYQTQVRMLSSKDRNARLLIGLSAVVSSLDSVTVTAMQNDIEILDLGKLAFDPDLVENVPTTAEKDVFRMMQLIPGVTATNELQSGLEVNGGNSNQNLVTFDGFTVYHMDHFFGYFSAINPYSVKSMRLFKTGFDARYGGSASSVMEFTGKDGNSEEVSGRFSVNPLSINTSLEAPISDEATLFLSGRRSYTDLLNIWHFNRIFQQYEDQIIAIEDAEALLDSIDYEPEFTFGDINIKVSGRLGPKNLVAWSLYNSNDLLNFDNSLRLKYPQDSIVKVNDLGFLKWGNIGTSLRVSRLWDENHFTDFLISYASYRSEYSEKSSQIIQVMNEVVDTQSTDVTQDNSIRDFSVDLEHEWSLEPVVLTFGVQNALFSSRIFSQTNAEIYTDKDQKQVWLSTQYVNLNFRPFPDSEASIGLRNNYLSSRDRFYLEPRASFRYDLSERLSFSAAGGLYSQFVNQINTQNVLEGSRDLWSLADEDIPVQTAGHLVTGMSYRLASWDLELNYFRKTFSGLLDYAFSGGNLLTAYENFEQLFFEGEGRAKGIEGLAKYESARFTGWLGYTLSKTDYRFDDIDAGSWFAADHDQRHEVNLFGSYRVGDFRFYSTWFFGSGRPFTEFDVMDGGKGRRRGDRPEVSVLVATGGRNNERLQVYHRLDLGASFNRKLGQAELQLNANIFNVYDRENIFGNTLRTQAGDAPDPNSPPDDGPGGDGPGDSPGDGPGGGDPNTPQTPEIARLDFTLMRFTPSISIEIRF